MVAFTSRRSKHMLTIEILSIDWRRVSGSFLAKIFELGKATILIL